MMGKAAFFAPEISIVPSKRLGPLMRMESIGVRYFADLLTVKTRSMS